MTWDRLAALGQLLQREAWCPPQVSRTLVPFWQQVYERVVPFLRDDEHRFVAEMAEAYLGLLDQEVPHASL